MSMHLSATWQCWPFPRLWTSISWGKQAYGWSYNVGVTPSWRIKPRDSVGEFSKVWGHHEWFSRVTNFLRNTSLVYPPYIRIRSSWWSDFPIIVLSSTFLLFHCLNPLSIGKIKFVFINHSFLAQVCLE